MEYEELLNNSKWEIISSLSKGQKSAVEIAAETKQSLANVSQQLKLLQAHKIIKKTDINNDDKKKPGKPRTPYKLDKEMLSVFLVRPGMAEKKHLDMKKLDDFHNFFFNLLFILNPEDHYYVLKYACDTDLMAQGETMGFLQSNDKEIELMIITENLKDIREKFSNLLIPNLAGKTKKIISWSHNKKEIEEGLARKEAYFVNLIKKSKVLIDKDHNLSGMKQMLEDSK